MLLRFPHTDENTKTPKTNNLLPLPMNRRTFIRWKTVVAAVLTSALLVLAFPKNPLYAADVPTLTSDKEDYAPGETVTLTGSGFWAGETIDLSISIDDPATGTHIGDFDWEQFNTDVNGAFVTTYIVPPEAADKVLTATAMGLSSSLVATVTFTDHGPSPVTSTNFSLTKDASHIVTVSVLLGGGSTTVSLTAATAKIANETFGGTVDVNLTSPGGNGNGTWTGSFQGTCATQYKINNVSVTWTTGHDHNSTETPGGSVTVTTDACPSANNPPVINCLSPTAMLGDIVGCINGDSFGTQVSVAYSFNSSTGKVVATLNGSMSVDVADVTDADGDALDVTVNGPTSVTLTGPGQNIMESLSVDISAEDPDGAEDSETCSLSVKANVVYNFGGFGAPLSETTVVNIRNVKRGSTVPVKFRLYDCNGVEICTTLAGAPHTISIEYSAGAVPSEDPVAMDSGSSNNDGTNFRYSGTCGLDGNWIYNLKITPTDYQSNSTYKIIAHLNDGTTHCAYVGVLR